MEHMQTYFIKCLVVYLLNLLCVIFKYHISGPIKFLTSLLQRSLKNSNHRYLGFSSSELAEGLTQIAVNDNNKKTVKDGKNYIVLSFHFYILFYLIIKKINECIGVI